MQGSQSPVWAALRGSFGASRHRHGLIQAVRKAKVAWSLQLVNRTVPNASVDSPAGKQGRLSESVSEAGMHCRTAIPQLWNRPRPGGHPHTHTATLSPALLLHGYVS